MKNVKCKVQNVRAGASRSLNFTLFILHFALCTSLYAVKPGQWSHQTEADFSAAELKGVIVTNLGDVQLARASKKLAELGGEDSIVYDIESLDDGRVLAAVGPAGKVVRLDEGKVANVAEFEGSQVFAIAGVKGGVWVAVSGTPSRLELRGGDDLAVQRTIELPGVRYVWDIAADGPRIWLATGTEGKALVIDTSKPEPQVVVALDTPHANLLCLGLDGAGRAYVGGDGEGIVYRLTRLGEGYEAFALYDSPEPEIGAMLVLEDGTVFAGTADVEQAKPGRLEQAQAQQVGRAERPEPGNVNEKVPNVPPKPEPKGDAKKQVPQEPAPAPVVEDAPNRGSAPTPTKEQYDELRGAVRDRLEQARQTGQVKLQAGPMPPSQGSPAPSGPGMIRSRTGPPAPPTAKKGNAIYRISPDGFVREVFRDVVVILRIVGDGSGLYAATGNEGELYHVDPDAEQVTLLARFESKQLPALWRGGDGAVLIGTANPGLILRLDDRYGASGTLRSPVLDASQISLWGKLNVSAEAPKGTRVEVQTRSGNVNNPDDGQWWSGWSPPQELSLRGQRSGYVDVTSPPARFLQYRLTFHSEGAGTPTVLGLSLRYLTPNMRPKIASIKAEYLPKPATDPQPLQTLKVTWESADPNNDKLTYTVEAREASAAAESPFLIIAKDLTPNSFDWDTRTIPDGRYVLRVTASDAADNIADQALASSRRSDPVVVDNTPPTIENLNIRPGENRSALLTADVADGLSPVTEVRYRVGGSDDWVLVLPEDLIYDSTSERMSVTIEGLSQGTVNVTLRATDALGNSRYANRTVSIK